MRNATSHKPALVRYFPLAIVWIKRAWNLYRLFDLVKVLAEVITE